MGKRLYSQRRGRGTSTFKAKLTGIDSKYINIEGTMKGEVTDLIKESGRDAIIVEITFDNNDKEYVVAGEGIYLGQKISHGPDAEANIGNITLLEKIPEGCPIYNIERVAGDGGQLVRTSGSYALLVSKDSKKAIIKMPSGKLLSLPLTVKASIGNVSCGGRSEKPFVKAGNKFFAMKAKKKFWPNVRGVAMNAVDHPFGGSQHHPGKSKSTSRNAPPGRKVGAIGSKRTGRIKKN
ncbi:MAG: 50S ribosomal protein L2 [Candidatus ainarchaeum sp.]|nr:50S ribosomal protein L2 [Candidatus ainarchaeum sp.]